MKRNEYHYRVIFEPSEGNGYWAYVPELPGCFTQGGTLEEAELNVRDAIRGYIRVAAEQGIRVADCSEGAIVKEVQIGL